MPSVTLAESAKLCQNELDSGVIETVITVNQFFQVLPFDGIDGNALAYNRENALGDVDVYGVDDTITSDNPATFTNVTSTLTTILGDAKVNGLIQATRSGQGNNQRAIQIASKAKSCGRKYQDMFINGTGVNNQFPGLLSLVDSSQTIYQDTGGVDTNGGPLSFAKLDALLDLVVDKDGEIDYLMMNARTIRSYFALLRGLGGASIGDTVTLPSGKEIAAYRSIPIFRNDYIPLTQTRGSLTTAACVFAGTLDDGSRLHGLAGITAQNAAGLMIEDVGVEQTRDNTITRVKWYAGLALFSLRGLAMLGGVSN